ncbi:hypothetical protein [Streptomyces erythrochromogenes]|uniref:hypothetical protein n=1 Tax=Streptomyces erythrochromogenes TaxID=285574 RepID=UPI00382F9F13
MSVESQTEPREFLRKLREGDLTPRIRVIGMVKAGEGESDHILFSRHCTDWIPIPVDMIQTLEHLDSVQCKDHSHPLAAITFREPESPEVRVFAGLFSSYQFTRKLTCSDPNSSLWECLAGCSGLPADKIGFCIQDCVSRHESIGGS